MALDHDKKQGKSTEPNWGKRYTYGAFHLSELASRTMARPAFSESFC